MHNPNMPNPLHTFLLALTLTAGLPAAFAQDTPVADESDDSSRSVEESDEAYRRRMELEDARNRDAGYTVPSAGTSSGKGLEKIDKLPAASRDNIRDQLVDVIMENGEWEPFDALREYPYEPTAAAQAEPKLMQEEQEAWDEQIRKYHEREAAAYGATRGPVPGPGNPEGKESGGEDGGQGGDQGEQGAGEQGAGDQGGEQGGGESGASGGEAGSSGTYQPYESSRSSTEDEVSTAGARQSALDFLRGLPGQAQAEAPPVPEAEPQREAEPQPQSDPETEPQPQPQPEPEPALDTRGIIAIEDLDKLEGAEAPEEPEDSPEDAEDR